MAVRLFATGSLVVFGLLLGAVVSLTSNTANILAWGVFGSTTEIAGDFATVVIYEAVHTSGALSALALGCWVALLWPLVAVYRATEAGRALPRFYGTLAMLLFAMLAIAGFCNLHLMCFPGDSWRSFWVKTLLESPAETPEGFWLLWLFVVPLPVTIWASVGLWPQIRWWTVAACLLASLLLVYPLLLRTYLAHHYLCFSDPEMYSSTLSALSPVLFAVPVAIVYLVDRRRSKLVQPAR